jgi:predicted nuclease of predicted toxin-antitoxin system
VRRILLDQGLAPHAAAILREQEFDAVHVSEIGMARAEDTDILDSLEGTCECDTGSRFHVHLATTGQGRPSVILLRVEGLNAIGQAALILSVCLQCDGAPLRRRCNFRRL